MGVILPCWWVWVDLCKGLNEKLKEYWSPEKIVGRLKLDKKVKISTETVYRFVLQDKTVDGVLYKYLRHQHKKYHKRYGKTITEVRYLIVWTLVSALILLINALVLTTGRLT